MLSGCRAAAASNGAAGGGGGGGALLEEVSALSEFTPSFMWLLRDFYYDLEGEHGVKVGDGAARRGVAWRVWRCKPVAFMHGFAAGVSMAR